MADLPPALTPETTPGVGLTADRLPAHSGGLHVLLGIGLVLLFVVMHRSRLGGN
jgi:hypothetical protein